MTNRIKLITLSVCALFVGGLRDSFATANVETAAGTHAGSITRRADAALASTHLLLKKGSDERHVAVCGASDYPVGSSSDSADAAEDLIHVDPLSSGKTRRLRCATALGDDIDVYTAANGFVQAEPGVAGTCFKVGRTVATAVIESTGLYTVEVETHSPVKLKVAATPADVAAIAAALNGAQLVKFLSIAIALGAWFFALPAQASTYVATPVAAVVVVAQPTPVDHATFANATHSTALSIKAYVVDVVADRWTQSIFAVLLALAACAYLPKKYRSFGAFIRYLKERARDTWLWLLKLRLLLRSTMACLFGRPPGLCTANSGVPTAEQMRTANARAVFELLAAARVPTYESTQSRLEHELITTANASLFQQAHFSEPETTYALGWTDPDGYDALSDFVAPPVLGLGDRYEHIEYPNAEAFLSEVHADDDLRAIGAEFKTVDYTLSRRTGTIPNRGLRIVLDWDRIRTMPNWQRIYTDRLMQRLSRNAARRKVALGLASGVAVPKTWDATADPDLDIANEAKNSGDVTGIAPNRALAGLAAKLLRYASYGATANARGFLRSLSMEEGLIKVGLEARVDESRYQSGTSKVSIVGSKVLLFSAYGTSGEDPSNFKTARGVTSQGGRYAVYVRQLGVKFWEITVECYEIEWVASILGVRTITVS